MSRRSSLVRRTCGAVAVLAAIASLTLATTPGIDLLWFGWRIRAHRPGPALWICLLAAAGYAGASRVLWWPRVQRLWSLAVAALQTAASFGWPRLRPIWVASFLAAVVLVAGVVYGCQAIGGADSYGYVSLAHLMRQGMLVQPQAWVSLVPWPFAGDTFTPLGYRAGADGTSLVPVYSPGLSAVMALAMLPFGPCAPYFVVPVFAAGAVFLTFLLGRHIGTEWTGVGGAWLLSTSPAFLYMTTQPMSDVPVTAMWIAALWLTIRQTPLSALGAGMAAAWAAGIRMNLAPLVMAPALWLLWQAWRRRAQGARAFLPILAFGLGLAPGVVVLGLFNARLYGSALSSGYGGASGWFSLGHFLPNLVRYSTWLTETQTPLVWIGVASIVFPFGWLWTRGTARPAVVLLALFTLAIAAEYALYTIFDAWWYLRFLLPALPLIFIGLAHAGVRAAVARNVAVRIAVVVVLGVIGLRGVSLASQRFAFDMRDSVGQFAAAGRVVRVVTAPSSVIYSMQHSGSVRHYAGRMTLRWDQLDPFWLDRSVSWFRDRGIHAYAVLDAWEVADWRRRFASRNALGALDFMPLRVFEGSSGIALYDLTTPAASASRTVALTALDARCQPPALTLPFLPQP